DRGRPHRPCGQYARAIRAASPGNLHHPLASVRKRREEDPRFSVVRATAQWRSRVSARTFSVSCESIFSPRAAVRLRYAAVRLRYEALCLCDEIGKPLGEFQALCQLYPPVLLPEEFVLYVLIVRLNRALAAFSRLRITVADPVRWLLKHSTRRPFWYGGRPTANEAGPDLFPEFKNRQCGRSVAVRSAASLESVDRDHGLGERLWRFLRKVVTDAARDQPVLIFSREFLLVGTRVGMRRAIGVAFEGDGRHGDDRSLGESLFNLVGLGLALSQCEPPAIIMDRDGDMIRVLERRRAAIEGGVVEIPFRRRELPDELRKVVPVFLVAGPATLRGKIELVPPIELGLRRQRHLAGFLAADEITAHRHHRLAALRPERCDDVRSPRSPIKGGHDGLLDLELIHEVDEIDRNRRRLAIPERFTRQKARRAIAAQKRDEHPVARRGQRRSDVDKAVNVVGPTMQQNDRSAVGGSGFGISHIQEAGIDLLERSERCICPRLDCRQFCLSLFCRRRTHHH